MDPITRGEMFLAAAAGEYDGELPAPITRQEQYLKKIINQIDGGGSVSPEQIDAAIESYLNSHDADIVTEQELSDAISAFDLGMREERSEIINELYSAIDTKQDALTAGDNISIETINDELTISATDTTYSDATQQTHGLMSTADKTKLDSITAAKIQAWDAAEQNVNADWNAESGDAQILHKPDLSVYALAANVTKSALGIDNVDNTSDADKPISTATETALAGKVDKETNKSLMSADEHTKLTGIESGAQVNAVTGVKGNAENNYRTGEINISPANIGLGNVDNTSDANKPISTATQTALNAKQDALTAGENITIETVNGELTISAADTDTWVPNSSGAAGYVASGEGQANKAWMTDENGNPAWRAASAPTDAQVQTAVYRYLENENLEEMVQTSGGAMTPDIKRALLDAFAHVAWADANGLTYYNTLETALFPNLDLVSISAVYTQTKPIYTDNSLDDLRSELVVTANYSNSSSEVVSFYTLTGTLNAGTRAITVTYGGKTATFQVVVTPENVWISALGNGGHSAQPAYSPFVLPSSTYQYDYSKEITAIELNVITAGQLSIGYCTRSTLSGTYSYSDSVFVTHEVLSTVKAGTQKIRLQTPLTIPSGYTLFFGVPTDTMDFDYGGTFTNGFYYHNLSTDKWAVQNRTIGMNIYTA